MLLTDQIIAKSGGMLSTVPEYGDANYLMYNGGSVEVEVAEFLYGFVRMVKPYLILETGTHKGVSAVYMGHALKDNGDGALVTLEFERQHVNDARALLSHEGLTDQVYVLEGDARLYRPDGHVYDMLFLDSEPDLRFAELLKFYPYMAPGAYAFIHDLHSHMHQVPNEEHGFAWPYGPIPLELSDLVNADELRPVHWENPRGMTAFYKPHQDTYRW